jgi:dihydrofolate reductase
MIISLIVAAAENDVIGRDGALPWRLPKDARRFRELTTGHVVVMGRVTYDSIVATLGHPLPDRLSVVVTRAGRPPGSAGEAAGAITVAIGTRQPDTVVFWEDSLEAALDLAERIAAASEDTELFVVGGVSIYRDALLRADRIYLTRVHHVVDGDRSMPPGWLDGFDLVRSEEVTDEKSHLAYSFLDYERARR